MSGRTAAVEAHQGLYRLVIRRESGHVTAQVT